MVLMFDNIYIYLKKSDINRQIWIPSGVVKRGSEIPHGLAMPRSELVLEIELNGEFSTFEYWRVYPTWMELKILIMYIYIYTYALD